MYCSRRLYKGNEYEICLPIKESGVTQVNFYTDGEIKVEKEPVETTGDTMCFDFSVEDLDVLADGVLRYEVVTEYETTDTNAPFVVVTPAAYSAKTLDELLEDAYESGLTACSGGSCEGAYNSGYTNGYASGSTDGFEEGYTSGYTDGLAEGYDSGYTAGQEDCSGYTQEDLDAAYASGYTKGYQDGFDDCHGPEPVYSAMPLTFEIISGGTIGWNSQANIEIEYSVDCGSTWSTFNNPISVNAGDMVQFRGTGRTGTDSGDSNYSYFTTSGALFNACGNLYSLLNKTNYSVIDDLTQYGKSTFRGLFRGNTGLTSAENLIMKANTLSESCYYNMFSNCTKLTTSPELPARVLVIGCYWGMFEFCRSLRSIRCYAVENTTSITCLAAWVTGTPSDGTFYKHPNATWNTSSEGIPYGWTVVDIQP